MWIWWHGSLMLASNIYRRSIFAAIETAGTKPPTVVRAGAPTTTCLSWHVKGTCTVTCHRCADHVVNSSAEKDALWEWVKVAFA